VMGQKLTVSQSLRLPYHCNGFGRTRINLVGHSNIDTKRLAFRGREFAC
jgi:hypothetical protein